MPKRTDIKKILILGSGPIVIGQACEFDYSGTQAVKALKEEGYEVVLVNSNPATIMTDPEFAHSTYIEPLNPEVVAKIIEKERPQAVLPTLGGQTALNLAMALDAQGILQKYNVELIGAKVPAIRKAEDREEFKKAMIKIGVGVPKSGLVHSMEEALQVAKEIGFPLILRPAFTLGGTGGGIAHDMEEYRELIRWGLDQSPVRQILVEESLVGWKEYELEVMRDKNDNVVIICSIENLDPMGVHTGDSITIAPAQTLTDKEYQILRDASVAIIREIGVETGGSNIQFAINPADGRMIAIEMNPRVSRSSALASKATGFPIAKIATKLAVGYTLDEISNDITRYTPASFEPTLDYVVTKIPRFAFEKFRGADDRLTTQMKSVGEVMAIGRTFKESLQKAMRSLETDRCGFDPIPKISEKELEERLRIPKADRLWIIGEAFRRKMSFKKIQALTLIDPWFLGHIEEIIQEESQIQREFKRKVGVQHLEPMKRAKQMGFSDKRIAQLISKKEEEVRSLRKKLKLKPVYKRVDTCAAEFEAFTPYLYGTYDAQDDSKPTKKKKVVILGGGPNRIGQGIEFDYCCVHASFSLSEAGYETIMVNCNPETVSTDYDTSDRLYFEPLTQEDVLAILENEKPYGVIVQFGGQTPLKLSKAIQKAGFKILGTSPDSIDIAEDRKRFQSLLKKLKLKQPENGTATTTAEAIKTAKKIGYPVVVRPSYVLGGRAMEIVYDDAALKKYMEMATLVSGGHPILIDKFLESAIEIDVDCVSDGKQVVIGGIMEHIEEAGIHSGDSACCIPPHSLFSNVLDEVRRQTILMAKALKVVGLMNVQFAVKNDVVYVLEVNPRASRTIPFVSKAIGKPLAKIASLVMVGKSLKSIGFTEEIIPTFMSVKEVVLPFSKFPGVDTLLGPEMKSTGEVMGIADDFGSAFAKAQIGAYNHLPKSGTVFISVNNRDKPAILDSVRRLSQLGFNLLATHGTADYFRRLGIEVDAINKVAEGSPHVVDVMKEKKIAMVVNTPLGRTSTLDSYAIRRTAIEYNVPYFTTTAAANAATSAIVALKEKGITVKSIQESHGLVRPVKEKKVG
ncbi:MAG: carbamoyl-phosphate synthase large subunit [Deltaproteobacteria bacterium]|nr:carbamoyl-phosphate synthase large subunit [Deltaproteobacteria bacterium]